MDFRTVNQAHICDIIKSLKSKGSLDIDGISTNLLKAVQIEISHPLAHIFKRSLHTGAFPNKLKISRAVPIFKAGDPKLCDNYCMIALLSSISKILEKVVSVRLVGHLEQNNILQYIIISMGSRDTSQRNIVLYMLSILFELLLTKINTPLACFLT